MPKKSTKFEFKRIRLIDDQPIDDLENDYLGLMPWDVSGRGRPDTTNRLKTTIQ